LREAPQAFPRPPATSAFCATGSGAGTPTRSSPAATLGASGPASASGRNTTSARASARAPSSSRP